ncbi:hypothetical protein [Tateyamaria sp.]|uniref:hypothetical protein n=1 Tax=Tateyamaria sp. TaxID=1929288 RepID=UPI00327CE722
MRTAGAARETPPSFVGAGVDDGSCRRRVAKPNNGGVVTSGFGALGASPVSGVLGVSPVSGVFGVSSDFGALGVSSGSDAFRASPDFDAFGTSSVAEAAS